MDKAVNILSIKINNESKIRISAKAAMLMVYAPAIFYTCLKYLGADVDVVVPHRSERWLWN